MTLFRKRVTIKDIPSKICTEFKLILQSKKIPFDKLASLLPETKRVTLTQLKEHVRALGRFENEEDIELICRYLVENDEAGDLIEYNENTSIDHIAIVSKFKNRIIEDQY
jgi:hypothetical protein